MRRSVFIEHCTEWEELIEFCKENNCDVCCDIYTEAERDDIINEGLADFVYRKDWDEVASSLAEIPTGYDYYKYHGMDITDWEWMDDNDDFASYKNEVIEYMDTNGLWEEEEIDEEDQSPLQPEPLTVSELFEECNKGFKALPKTMTIVDDEEYILF